MRVALLVLTLIGLPSFTLSALHQPDSATLVAAPVGANAATATPSPTLVSRDTATATATGFARAAWEEATLGGIDEGVFELALRAANCAVKRGVVTAPATLTVIDYSRPSTDERLWVYDLRAHRLLFNELVAHGQGSGANLATSFSNEPDTHRTSIGLFVTDDTYVGRNGYSLRLNGLDRGFNDKARDRAIVMHGAPYVNRAFAKAQGRIGRSWGCPALDDAIARKVIDTVKGGSLVFSYYPNDQWMQSSPYLGNCGD